MKRQNNLLSRWLNNLSKWLLHFNKTHPSSQWKLDQTLLRGIKRKLDLSQPNNLMSTMSTLSLTTIEIQSSSQFNNPRCSVNKSLRTVLLLNHQYSPQLNQFNSVQRNQLIQFALRSQSLPWNKVNLKFHWQNHHHQWFLQLLKFKDAHKNCKIQLTTSGRILYWSRANLKPLWQSLLHHPQWKLKWVNLQNQ